MSEEKETITIQIPENFSFKNLTSEKFDVLLESFDWSLEKANILFEVENKQVDAPTHLPYLLFFEVLIKNGCLVYINEEIWSGLFDESSNQNLIDSLIKDEKLEVGFTVIEKTKDAQKMSIELAESFIKLVNIEYSKPIRYIINELLYNSIEHGKSSKDILTPLQFIWNSETNEFSLIVADVGIGIRQHLRQTYPNLVTDSDAILHAIKPQISGTFGRPNTGYETKNNAGVGLYFSSNIVQRLNADMFIVSGNGFVHISPNEIIAKELDNQWKGTFVYVKIKLGLIKELNFQKMLAEITKSIPKANEAKEENKFYISVRDYFGKYAEDKDLAKKIRDKYLLPALAENKTLTIDFEEIISAPHSLLNAMLATPIERLGLAAYKKIKIINAAPDIRETLDFIFDDNTSND